MGQICHMTVGSDQFQSDQLYKCFIRKKMFRVDLILDRNDNLFSAQFYYRNNLITKYVPKVQEMFEMTRNNWS